MTTPEGSWGTCTYCGDAVAPTASSCRTCGNDRAVGGARSETLGRREKYRLRFVLALKSGVVVAVVVGVGYLLLGAALTGPPTYTDPLTTSRWFEIGPGNFSALSGSITGEDYVAGNYSVANPPGAPVTLLVLNQSEFFAFLHHQPARPLANYSGQGSSRVVFAAPYTDTFHFVFLNPFASSTRIVLSVYVVTNYQSNVVLG